jgi:hypothetical protein
VDEMTAAVMDSGDDYLSGNHTARDVDEFVRKEAERFASMLSYYISERGAEQEYERGQREYDEVVQG